MHPLIVHIESIPGDSPSHFGVSLDGCKAVPIKFNLTEDIRKAIKRLQDRDSPFRFQTLNEQDGACTLVGEALFATFFQGSVLAAFQKYRTDCMVRKEPSRIALHLPRNLYQLPWELLRDPSDPPNKFLSVLGSLVRYDSEAKPPQEALYEPVDELNFLYVTPSPAGNQVPNFERLPSTKRIKFMEVKPATFDDLQKSSNWTTKRNGFLFFGHGRVEHPSGVLVFTRRDGNGIFVEDARTGEEVSVVFDTRREIMVSLLCACESAWIDEKLTFDKCVAGAIFNGTWLAFVVGAQNRLNFEAAVSFLRGFVHSLAAYEPFDLAVSRGRLAIRTRTIDPNNKGGELSRLDWWIPVVYTRTSNFEIFKRKDKVPIPVASAWGSTVPSPTESAAFGSLVEALLRQLKRSLTTDSDILNQVVDR